MAMLQQASGEGEAQTTLLFTLFARWTERQVGRSSTFLLAIAVVLLWAVSGPIFGFSDTWQLVINTATTIVTFLMVFVIQATQNRDSKAIHLKLDELLRAVAKARTDLVGLENMTEQELLALEAEFVRIKARQARRQLREKA